MSQQLLYPLRFEPIYQYRLWGGRRLADLLSAPLPGDGPIGEAWVLSDRDDHPSLVADGPLKGRTSVNCWKQFPEQMLGKLAGRFRRFPLLLKFLDAREMLSVQVHPTKANDEPAASGRDPKNRSVGGAGGWSTKPRVRWPETRYFGRATCGELFRDGTVPDELAWFTPQPGDAVFLKAGTVHSLGGDVVVFEIQQNSDVTFRLFDWDHVDAKTGQPRALQVDKAIACIDFAEGPVCRVDACGGVINARRTREAVRL